jgi:hypothetical protein
MNKSCQNKLEKILEVSDLNPNQQYLCQNGFTGESIILNYREASVYGYINHWYSLYHKNFERGHQSNVIKAIRNYDKAREVFRFMNSKAYYTLVD